MTGRQLEIVELVNRHAPITSEQLADLLQLSRPTIRSDLALLVMLGYLNAKPKVGYYPGRAGAGADIRSRLLELKVRDVQGIPVIVRENATVHDAAVTLFVENVGSLIVTDESGHQLLGVVTRKDLLKVTLAGGGAGSMPVSMVMTRQANLVTVSPDDSVLDAAQKLIRHEVNSLPVVLPGPHGGVEIVGRISKTTMTKVLLDITAE